MGYQVVDLSGKPILKPLKTERDALWAAAVLWRETRMAGRVIEVEEEGMDLPPQEKSDDA